MIHITTQELHVRYPFVFSNVQFSAGGVLFFNRLSNFKPIQFHQK